MTINNFINTKKSNITRYNKQHTNKTTLLSSPIMTRKILLLGLVLICIVLQLFTDFLSSLKQQQQPQQYENKNNNVNDYYYYDEKVAEINDPLKDIMPSSMYRKSNNIPNWMKEYFDWHRKQTSMLNDTNWNSTTAIQSTIPPRPIMANNANKFLIIRCLNKDNHCGGLSDRIKPLLVFIAIAAHTNRILMIRWERPYPIEEFLLPNELNWTVPSYMLNELRKGKSTVSKTYVIGRGIEGKLRTASATVLESRMQSQDGGSTLYPCVVETMLYDGRKDSTNGVGSLNYNDDDNDPELNNSTTYDHCKTLHRFSSKKYAQKGRELYRTIYHDFFRSMFKPHPKIQYIIDDKMKKSNLVPGQFIGCHYRSDYGPGKGKKTGTDMISFVAKKQVRCAALMRPGYPVYFAGDSSTAVNAVREEAASKLLLIENDNNNNSMTTIVITPELSKQSEQHNYTKSRSIPGPLHLDLDKGKVEDFYPAFVDLLVMGNSMCHLYGIGGFGSFASLLSYNASCFYETTGECDGEKHLPKNECCMKYIYKRRQTDALNLAMSF